MLVALWCPELHGEWKTLTNMWRDGKAFLFYHEHYKDVILEESPGMNFDDIETLVSKNILFEVKVEDVMGAGISFTVDEVAKHRRRWILHPKLGNLLFNNKAIDIPFPSLVDMEQHTILSPAGAILYDFSWFFGQFEICLDAALHNCILLRDKDGVLHAFAPRTVPTGACSPPLFAQILSLAVARAARNNDTTILADAFVDNIRLCGAVKENLLAASNRLVEVCAAIGITINDENHNIQTKYVYLGILFCHDTNTVSIAEKTRIKLATCLDSVNRAATDKWTLREISSAFGVCVWAASILGIYKHDVYYVYKYVRRRASTCSDFEPTSLWPCVVHLWSDWIMRLRASGPKKIFRDEPGTWTVFTDASDDGWGCTAFCGNQTFVVAGKWTKEMRAHHINLRELIAVRLSIQSMADKGLFIAPTQRTLSLWVDNTSTLFQIRGGGSKCYLYNKCIGHLNHLLTTLQVRLCSTAYISSKENPADVWSRLGENYVSLNVSKATYRQDIRVGTNACEASK